MKKMSPSGKLPFAGMLLALTTSLALAGPDNTAFSGPRGDRPAPPALEPISWPFPWGTSSLELPPMIGHVGPHEAHLWLATTRPAQVEIRIGRAEDLSDARPSAGLKLKSDSGCMGSVTIRDLEPATKYFYGIVLDGELVRSAPYPSFVTAPDEKPGRIRFGFTSCVGNEGKLATDGYRELAGAYLDLLLMLGDSTYANSSYPATQRRFLADQRRTVGWQRLALTTPIYAIWDDHDYGPNNSDRRLRGKGRSLKTFTESWANPGSGEADNPGVYFKFRRRDVEFFMLDGRYHRDPNAASNLVHKTMLGDRQLAWLKRELMGSTARIKVLASGGEWQSRGAADSWTSFARERDEIFGFIDENRIESVLLLSGDRHYTAAYQVRGRWLEVTSGPLGSPPTVVTNLPEMFLNLSPTKGHFYSVYDVDTSAVPPRVTLEVHQVGVGLAHRRTFSWGEVNGTTRIALLPPSPPPLPLEAPKKK